MHWTFNNTLPQLVNSFSQPKEEDLPPTQFKYADFDHAYRNTTDYIRQILSAAPLKNKHRNLVVDIKVTQIKKGQPPCIPGWHCDTVVNPFHDSLPEFHHLFVTGHASLTEFIAQPITLEVNSELKSDSQQLLQSFKEQITAIQVEPYKIPSATLVTYGRFHFHRGSIGLYDEKRLLVRVTETNIITPRNSPFHSSF